MLPRLQDAQTLRKLTSINSYRKLEHHKSEKMLLKQSTPRRMLKAMKSSSLALPEAQQQLIRALLGENDISDNDTSTDLLDISPFQVDNQEFEYSQDLFLDSLKQANYNDDEQIIPTKLTSQESNTQYDVNKNISFKVNSLCPAYKIRSTNQILPAMVSLQAQEQEAQMIQIGLDLICLIDVSTSMEGTKLTLVKKTLKLLLEFLSNKDRLCIIAFNHQPQRLYPLSVVNLHNKKRFRQLIDNLQSKGGTNIELAIALAFAQLSQRRYINNVSAIFLLSDGCNASPCQAFIKERLKYCLHTFTIYTFGFGLDHDAELMTDICTLKNGSFYFVSDLTMLDEFFVDALGGLVSVVAHDIKIQVSSQGEGAFKGVKIRKVFGSMWKNINIWNKQSYKINLEQLSAGHRKDYVFEIELPANNYHLKDYNRRQRIVKAQLQFQSTLSKQIITKQYELLLDFYNEDELMLPQIKDYDLAAQYYRVKAAEAIERAKKLCQSNLHTSAIEKLEKLIDKIRQKNEIVIIAQGTLQDLEQAKQAAIPYNFNAYGLQQMSQISCNNYGQIGVNSNFSDNGIQLKSITSQFSNQTQKTLIAKIPQTCKTI